MSTAAPAVPASTPRAAKQAVASKRPPGRPSPALRRSACRSAGSDGIGFANPLLMQRRHLAAFSLGALVTCAGLGAGIAARTKRSSAEKTEVVRLDGKIVYRLPRGASLLGDPVPSPDGDAIAFLERKDDGRLALVVCIEGAD